MAFAPIDVWWRLLRETGGPIGCRYWPRLIFALTCSVAATVLTLPERLMFSLWMRLRGRASVSDASAVNPAPLFVLGYYRSGTTHLQYLLDRDPQLRSPRWCEALAPQGFVVSWAVLRFVLTPFVPSRRPMDGVAFGPELPAEDDFALNNWALASTLPGRFALPRAHARYDRFNDLTGLTSSEFERWQRCLRAFFYKLSLVSGGRRLLSKTPSHTARVKALLRLFPDARFIHLSRTPREVLRSNLAMADIAHRKFHLQDALPAGQAAAHIAEEFRQTEERYLEARESIPAGQLVELRFQDLLADPLGELRRAYAALGLEFTERFEQNVLGYLEATRTYRQNAHTDSDCAHVDRWMEDLAPLARVFGHDRPPIPQRAIPLPALRARPWLAVVAGTLTAAGCAAAWLPLAVFTSNRLSVLIFPAGFAVGWAMHRAARRNISWLGAVSALLTLLLFLLVALATTHLLDYAPETQRTFADLWRKTAAHLRVEARLFWAALGALSAYRLASRLC